MPQLVKVITDPNSRSVENINPTENAISAVTKLLKYRPEATSLDEILPHWLSWLPTWEDEDEAVHIYGFLCDLVESNNAIILGANNANLPRLVAIMAEVFSRKSLAVDSEVGQRMVVLLKQILVSSEACFVFIVVRGRIESPRNICLQYTVSIYLSYLFLSIVDYW